MKRILTNEENARLDEQIARAEQGTKAQIVLAVIERSDSYAELPWKAFALVASVAGLATLVLDFLFVWQVSRGAVLVAMAGMLALGGACALLTIFLPGFARLFLPGHRAEVEVRQYAESLFLERELFATAERSGILLLVSLFERRVILLPDRGLKGRLTGEAMEQVIGPMVSSLARDEVGRALEKGVEGLSLILGAGAPAGPEGAGGNELPDGVIEEKGA